VGQRTGDGEKARRIEDEEGAQSEQHYRKNAHISEIRSSADQ